MTLVANPRDVIDCGLPDGRGLAEDRGLSADGEVQADATPLDALEPSPLGCVVTVYSPKGGVGTTFLATNLAVVIADQGRHRVCLVDLDLEFGDVAITTGLVPRRSILDAVDLDDTTADILDAVITPWCTGIDCVLAPVDPSAAERVSPELVATLLAQLRSRYDYVVVDTPSQLSEHVLEALDAADSQVLVCTPELPALKSVRLVLDTLELLGQDVTRRSVLVNRCDASSGLRPAEVAAAIMHPVAALVPQSSDVSVSIDAGFPLAKRRHEHPVVAAIRRFSADLITEEPIAATRRRNRFGLKTRTR